MAGDAESVLAARSPLAVRLMTAYMRHFARRHFHAVRLALPGLPAFDAQAPVIVYANHPSWWDPVLFVLLHAACFAGRAGYGPMDAAALGRYGVLRRIGVFGIDPATRAGAARFLQVGGAVLSRPATVLWVTAEGGFTDPRCRPLRLQPGVAHLLRRHPATVALPLALEYPFWNESRPEALARFGAPVPGGAGRSVAELESVLSQTLAATMDALAQDAMARAPRRFRSLAAGAVGVGGVYDLWRRARALLRGERAQVQHDLRQASE